MTQWDLKEGNTVQNHHFNIDKWIIYGLGGLGPVEKPGGLPGNFNMHS